MNKHWDYDVPSVELWREVLRVLKPGGHLLGFGGTRTYHRMVVNIEDAGFEIRDQVQWIYGSGFPKSMDVSKAIDKQAGITEWRETTPNPAWRAGNGGDAVTSTGWAKPQRPPKPVVETDDAKAWQGWGTALKPANEPIVLARKPLEKGLTVAANVLKWGTGAINVDASRVAGAVPVTTRGNSFGRLNDDGWQESVKEFEPNAQGRWPANVLVDESAAAVLDEQSGTLYTHAGKGNYGDRPMSNAYGKGWKRPVDQKSDSGGASRFFYVAKASKRERNAGLEQAAPTVSQGARPNSADASGKFPDHDHRERGGNNHPTVKPVKLMEYLVRMITPPGGVCLDPFMGSGSTGVACLNVGADFIGIEREAEYLEIAEKRISHSSDKGA